MIPHEKALVQRLQDKPFALLGINSDGPAEKARSIFEKHGITWRNAIDVSTDGPIATAWNVRGWPTIYVLDAKGVIRYRDVRDQAMESAVMRLLREMEGATAGAE